MNLPARVVRKIRNLAAMRAARQEAARITPGLDTRVCRRDDMMARAQPDQYFVAGRAALEAVERAVAAAGVPDPERVLDLPSGYGRVLRYLMVRWPGAEYTASELMTDAVDYCAATFGAKALVSTDPLWDADLQGPYDLIWSGSLFTHFDDEYWVPMLAHLGRALSPGGLLVFTSQGEPSLAFLSGSDEYPILTRYLPTNYGLPPDRAAQLVEDVRRTGFGFAHYRDTEDDPYGASISLPGWVRERLGPAGLREVHFETGGWGGHQDVWTVTPA